MPRSQVSTDDYEEYKRSLRPQLKAAVDADAAASGRGPTLPELVFVYVRPPGTDPGARGPMRVFEAMRKELSGRRRERCVRLDPPPPEALPAAQGAHRAAAAAVRER